MMLLVPGRGAPVSLRHFQRRFLFQPESAVLWFGDQVRPKRARLHSRRWPSNGIRKKKQSNNQTNNQTNKQTNKQTDKPTNKQTCNLLTTKRHVYLSVAHTWVGGGGGGGDGWSSWNRNRRSHEMSWQTSQTALFACLCILFFCAFNEQQPCFRALSNPCLMVSLGVISHICLSTIDKCLRRVTIYIFLFEMRNLYLFITCHQSGDGYRDSPVKETDLVAGFWKKLAKKVSVVTLFF